MLGMWVRDTEGAKGGAVLLRGYFAASDVHATGASLPTNFGKTPATPLNHPASASSSLASPVRTEAIALMHFLRQLRPTKRAGASFPSSPTLCNASQHGFSLSASTFPGTQPRVERGRFEFLLCRRL